eukprot:9474412-Pyramimonas_sp.AAC.1
MISDRLTGVSLCVKPDGLEFLCIPAPDGLDVSEGIKEIFRNTKCALLFHKDEYEDLKLDGYDGLDAIAGTITTKQMPMGGVVPMPVASRPKPYGK